MQRFRQILSELISNAIKFSGRGEVEVALNVSSRMDTTANSSVSVRGTGRGMTVATQKVLFDLFQQVDVPVTKLESGTGWGPALAKR